MNRKLKILQINSVNFGSTGSIMLNISKKIEEYGYVSYIAYANSRTNRSKDIDNGLLIGTILERNIHLQLAYLTGFNGCFSILSTKRFLEEVEKIKPDIIHLHNLHNCYINLRMLFAYIKDKKIQVVWTLHDCWAFTGQCPHFTMVKCDKWKSGCFNCPQYKQYPKSRVDKSGKMYKLKKEWFTGVEKLIIVTPSKWLADRVGESFLQEYPVKVISNGINLDLFKPEPSDFRNHYGLQKKKILLGVASIWNKSKGLDIFIELSKTLSDNYKIVLVGLSDEQIEVLPSNILGFKKIKDPKELAKIYSAADWFINPSLEETMGLVTVEALACGTPSIVSDSTAVPEAVDETCGIIVSQWKGEDIARIIERPDEDFTARDCINRAKKYDMYAKFDEYINIYKSIT